MSVTHVVGVDPGLVHTGVVRMVFTPRTREIRVSSEAIVGPNEKATAKWIRAEAREAEPLVFVERYKPRSTMHSDVRMVEAQARFRQALPSAEFILNTGVKKVVRSQLMSLLGVWRFTTVTNHQDLRSAARIALYGMLKDEALNTLIADIVRDHLEGRTWDVRH